MNAKLNALLIVLVLVGSAFLTYQIRAQPLQYAQELDEFDPYFNYRASEFLVANGIDAYYDWHDDMSWYPHGRDVSSTSQNMLHFVTAYSYMIFGGDMTLYDYSIYLPAVLGAITVLPMFLLVRVLTNTKIGLMAAFFYAVSVSFIQRGTAGWLKSEPLGLLFGISAIYLIVSGIKNIQHEKPKHGIIKMIAGGIIMVAGVSSWGGTMFFFIPLVLWIVMLPKLFPNFKTIHTLIGLGGFTVAMYTFSTLFTRASSLMSGILTFVLLGSIVFIIFQWAMQKQFGWGYYKSLVSFGAFMGIVMTVAMYPIPWNDVPVVSIGCGESEVCTLVSLPYDRYLNVLLPTSVFNSALEESVSEHQIPTFGHMFERTVFLMLFMPIGVLAIIKRKIPADVGAFALTFGVIGMYVGTTIVRLELFMSFGMILLASLGFWWIFIKFKESNEKRPKSAERILGYVIIVMLLAVTVIPAVVNWSFMMDRPPIIATGGAFTGQTDAWLETLDWIKNNTPENSKVLAWWDYGYWIETKAERVTFMDNAANNAAQIEKFASILTNPPSQAVNELRANEVDYVVMFFGGRQLPDSSSYAMLGAGGDLSKMGWILRIGEKDRGMYYDSNGLLNKKFYSDTLYGAMVPFTPISDQNQDRVIDHASYPWQQNVINPETGERFDYGWLYYNNSKIDYLQSLGLQLVYVSSEFADPPPDNQFAAVFVYKVI